MILPPDIKALFVTSMAIVFVLIIFILSDLILYLINFSFKRIFFLFLSNLIFSIGMMVSKDII